MNRHGFILRLVLLAALAGAIAWPAFHREILQSTTLEQQLSEFGRWSPILFVLVYSLATVLFVPGSILTVAGGALFGPFWGTLWNLGGATLGATLAFVIARYVGADWVAARIGERLARLIGGVEEEGWRFVAFVRVVPLFPFNLMNYAFGLTRIGLGDYAVASFVSMAPGTVAYTYLGYAGLEAVNGRAGAIHQALFALALLAAVAFLPRLVRRLRGRFTDAASLKRRLKGGENVALLEVRTAEEFHGHLGHIVGATNIPVTEISGRLQELTEMKGPIITI